MKDRHDPFFKAFLVIYVGFLILHSLSLNWASWHVPLALALGLGVAALAHTRYGIVTITLLLIHICLEWTEHARHGWHYSNGEIALHGVHACLDFVFLYKEMRMHVKRFYRLVFVGILCGLGLLFVSFYKPAPKNPHLLAIMRSIHASGHTHGQSSPLAPFVMGGMFGCILSHLLRKRSA